VSEEDEGGGDHVEEVAVVEEAAAEAGAAPVVSKTLTGVAETFIDVCIAVIATSSAYLPPITCRPSLYQQMVLKVLKWRPSCFNGSDG
jgi:hypothetical protein